MDELNRVRTASYIVLAHYNKLIELSVCDLEDNPQFLTEIETLKKYTEIERDEYNKLPDEIVMNYSNEHTVDEKSNSLERRVYFRIAERKNELISKKDNISVIGPSLPSAIASKVIIDIVKDVDMAIDKLNEKKLDDEDDAKVLRLYFSQHKYTLLTSDGFAEMIALNNNYNVKAMPTIDLYTVGKTNNVPLVPAAQEVFLEMISSSIDTLLSLNDDDMYHNTYISMMEVARIKSLLPYLDKEHLMTISNLFNSNSYRYEKNSALAKVKKIINKRKEEFNN